MSLESIKRFWTQVDLFLLLRFIACILVIRQHADFIYPFNPGWGWLLGGSNSSGGNSVVAFFTLSGFLMAKGFFSGRYQFNLHNIYKFYTNRIKRLVPLYYFVTILTIFYIFPYLIEPGQAKISRLLKLFTLTYDSSFLFNQVYWSITLEVIFYLICPFIFWLISLLPFKKIVPLAVTVASIFVILQPPFALFSFSPLLISFVGNFGFFMLGSAAALVASQYKAILPKSLVWISLVAVIISLLSPSTPFIIISVLCTLFIISHEYNPEYTSQKSISHNIINYFGMLSYAIYLTHMLVLFRLNELYRQYLINHLGLMKAGYTMLFMTIILTIILSIFLHQTVEKPGAHYAGIVFKWIENKIFRKKLDN